MKESKKEHINNTDKINDRFSSKALFEAFVRDKEREKALEKAKSQIVKDRI